MRRNWSKLVSLMCCFRTIRTFSLSPTDKGYDLVLAGHTHGGQVNVEIFEKNLNIASFVTPYTKGLYTGAASAVYVNSGIGTIGMPIRLGAPPEITLITLCDS